MAIREIARTKGHSNQVGAASKLRACEDAEDQSLARMTLREIAQTEEHPHQYKAADTLWASKDKEDQSIARMTLREIAQTEEHPHQGNAADTLWASRDKEDQSIARMTLKYIAQIEGHQHQDNAAITLWYSQDAEDRSVARMTLKQIIQKNEDPYQYYAAYALWYSKDAEDRSLARGVLKQFAYRDGHSFQYESANALWTSRDADDQSLAHGIVKQLAQTKGHPSQLDAASKLRASKDAEDQSIARMALREIAQTNGHPHQEKAADTLWHSGDAEDQSIARLALREIAQTKGHSKQAKAADTLWHFEDAEDQSVARMALKQIIDFQDFFTKRDIVRLFRESNDPADQAQGLEWQLKYFSTAYSDSLKAQIAEFNQEKFKIFSPKSLGDVEEFDSQDIPARFNDLMNDIETVDETSPHYVHISSITGYENPHANNTFEITNVKKKALGFLKTLTNQPLDEGEENGWQMYDENKPALINVLKHLVLALEKTEDPAIRLNNLGIILNGLLYCPTGQVEGMNSAVNTLIRGQHQLADRFEDKVATIVHEALHTAFLNAFGEGGSVHQLSRARTILYPHIGLSQVVDGFVERISRVNDNEIPYILETFYSVFTPQFLSQYIINHMETPEDRALAPHSIQQNLRNVTVKAEIQKAQQQRPLKMTDLYCWLKDNNLDPLKGFGFTYDEEAEIGHEYTFTPTPKTVQKVLTAMGWMNMTQSE